MNILISGSNGFIGSYLKCNFVKNGDNVVTIGLSEINDIKIDLSKTYFSIEGDFDLVIHCAGIVHSKRHSNNFDSTLINQDINITINFLKSISKISYKKLVYLSSVSVYGLDFGENISINVIENPKSGYALTRYISENLIKNIIPLNKYLILRLPLVNGKNPKGNIKEVIEAIRRGKMIIFKNNTCKKSVIELSDLFSLLNNKCITLSGIHNIKSYDIGFNDFINNLAIKNNLKLIILPLFVLKIISFLAKLFKQKNLVIKITKIKYSLTFSSSIDIRF
jgi:nucleoside-diphosphate-sugar epimerase